MQVSRQKLQAVAQALQEHRLLQLHTLHGSASFNQSHDNGTPGEQYLKTAGSRETEKSWGALFPRQNSKPPSAAGADLPLRIPPLPSGSRANILADRGRAGVADRVAGHMQGVGTPPSVAPQARQLYRQRSPSVGSLRCGALSYSSNGQASGSLNLDTNFEPSIGADGPLERHASIVGNEAQGACQHSDRPKLFRSSTLGRQNLLCRLSSLRPADNSQPSLRFPPSNSCTIQPDIEVENMGNCPTPSPKAAVLNRYFSSQLADEFVRHEDVPANGLCRTSAGDTGCSQIEVTGPNEEGRVLGSRNRRTNPVQPPLSLSNLYDRVARTKGREMVQKGLQYAAAEGSSIPNTLEDSAGTVSRERSAGHEGVHAGKGSARRTRGLKIASMVAGGKENSGSAAPYCSSSCKEHSSPQSMQARPLSLANAPGVSKTPCVVPGVLRPHRLNFTSLATGKPKDAVGMLSSRPELSVPPSFGRVLGHRP
jgi:hypothetical protein